MHQKEDKKKSHQSSFDALEFSRAQVLFLDDIKRKAQNTHKKNERLLYARGGVTRHEQRARESEDDQRVDVVFNSKKKH